MNVEAVLIQQIYPDTPGVKLFDLTREHHKAYCDKWGIDYQCVIEDSAPEFDKNLGNWAKLRLIDKAMAQYADIVWLDADTIIKDVDTNLRYAIQARKIGACWQRIPQLPRGHWNTGALYIHNSKETRKFMADWLAGYPPKDGWLEQGIFNELAMQSNVVVTLSDKWNATLDVSVVPDTVVLGFHGQGNPQYRYDIMKDTMQRLFPDAESEQAQGEREA